MKQFSLFIIAFLIFFIAEVSAQNKDDIVGEWYTEEERSVVEIYKFEDLYCGKITWLKYPKDEEGNDKVDNKNPDESKRNIKLVGLKILWGFRYKGDNEWADGKIYDPKNGKTYSCKMRLDGNKLNVRGYIGFSLIGRTTVWTKKI